MKIAITGHSAGIGQALARIYQAQGHEIVGLSRRTGYNIRMLPKIAGVIETCDMFINNAQSGFAQTELLFEVWRRWEGQENKHIIVISTQMTMLPVSPRVEWDEYLIQKRALEEACNQLRARALWPAITIVKPGAVATQPDAGLDHADANDWAEKLVACLNLVGPTLEINEITLGPNRHGS